MPDDLRPPSGPADCPHCGHQVVAEKEKPFPEFEAVSGRCPECGLTTIFGSDKWVQFPTCPCQQCLADVEHNDCPCTSAQFLHYKRAERQATADLRIIAKQAHDAHMALITPKMLVWRNHQLDINPTATVLQASSGALARELESRGWRVDGKVKRAPGRSGTLVGQPSIPMARVLESRHGEVVQRPEGAK